MSSHDRDWKTAGEECLTSTLSRMREIVESGADSPQLKVLESVAKTVGDIVGAANYLARRSSGGGSGGAASDDDD